MEARQDPVLRELMTQTRRQVTKVTRAAVRAETEGATFLGVRAGLLTRVTPKRKAQGLMGDTAGCGNPHKVRDRRAHGPGRRTKASLWLK